MAVPKTVRSFKNTHNFCVFPTGESEIPVQKNVALDLHSLLECTKGDFVLFKKTKSWSPDLDPTRIQLTCCLKSKLIWNSALKSAFSFGRLTFCGEYSVGLTNSEESYRSRVLRVYNLQRFQRERAAVSLKFNESLQVS